MVIRTILGLSLRRDGLGWLFTDARLPLAAVAKLKDRVLVALR